MSIFLFKGPLFSTYFQKIGNISDNFFEFFFQAFIMSSSVQILKLNLLPPEKLYCDFNYWSNLFTQDMQIIWEKGHSVPLKKLPQGISDMIFPYLLLALSDYKTSNKRNLKGIGLDNLLNLWFDKYSLNKNGYFELI